MAAPKGNKNALGNRGGARKSYVIERATKERLADMFFNEHSFDAISKMASKESKMSVEKSMLIKALNGDTKAQVAIFNKIYPDRVNLEGQLKTIPVGEQTKDKIVELYGIDHFRKNKESRENEPGEQIESDKK